MSSSLTVINEGLVRLGVPPLSSLADQSAQAMSAANIYTTTREAELAEHPWSFALREVMLSKVVSVPGGSRSTEFDYAYQMPGGTLRVLGLRSLDTFRLAGDQLFTNDREARLVYVSDVPESAWPSYFARLVSLSFGAAVAVTLTDSESRAALLYQQSDAERRRARVTDSQQTPPYVFNLMRIYLRRSSNPLVHA